MTDEVVGIITVNGKGLRSLRVQDSFTKYRSGLQVAKDDEAGLQARKVDRAGLQVNQACVAEGGWPIGLDL